MLYWAYNLSILIEFYIGIINMGAGVPLLFDPWVSWTGLIEDWGA